jgi:hypothetical protein
MADHPEYLKLPNAPAWDYHVWTPLLAARGDMVPYELLKTVEPEVQVVTAKGETTLRIIERSVGWYQIVDKNDKTVGPRIQGLEAAKKQLGIYLKKLEKGK